MCWEPLAEWGPLDSDFGDLSPPPPPFGADRRLEQSKFRLFTFEYNLVYHQKLTILRSRV